MSKTESFRAQHKEIGELVLRVEKDLSPDKLRAPGKAEEVRSTLSSLAGKLAIHLAMEDKSLYPQMLSSNNDEAKKMADSYAKEMGTLAGAFKDYVTKWGNAGIIRDDAEAFCAQTKEVFTLLKKRVEREEAHLYPLRDIV
jgi:hypothetical protein